MDAIAEYIQILAKAATSHNVRCFSVYSCSRPNNYSIRGDPIGAGRAASHYVEAVVLTKQIAPGCKFFYGAANFLQLARGRRDAQFARQNFQPEPGQCLVISAVGRILDPRAFVVMADARAHPLDGFVFIIRKQVPGSYRQMGGMRRNFRRYDQKDQRTDGTYPAKTGRGR